MTASPEKQRSRLPPWATLPNSAASLLRDLPVVLAGLALFYGLISLTRYWQSPAGAQPDIDLHLAALPKYAAFSLARIALAYVLSLAAAIAYGAFAAHSERAERFLIPLLDTLQSIPVLSFLPGVMLAMVALFPTRQLGVELGSILLILTGQVWNMAFSVYSSIKNIPREMREASGIYRFSRWQELTEVELPATAIGLVWNSMMSVAGAWFFLMACEMFTLGHRQLRLPGLGSYLQTASNAGDMRAIAWGLAAMIAVIVLIDQIVWRPAIAWSEKFKLEQVEGSQTPRSPVLELLRRSRLLDAIGRALIAPVGERLALRSAKSRARLVERPKTRGWLLKSAAVLGLAALSWGVVKMFFETSRLPRADMLSILEGAGATFLRVEATLALAGLWTIPAGVAIGLRPKLAAFLQPLAQIAASVPATALFPIVLLFLIRAGGGLGIGSILLLLLGTQWYILFNVIAGASAIPADLKEACRVYHIRGFERWRKLVLPAIFPYLVTGFVTASGGAWNASIVAEYFQFQGKTLSTVGLGAVISRATDTGDSPALLGATLVMAAMVVAFNRLVWRRMYRLASTRFKLET